MTVRTRVGVAAMAALAVVATAAAAPNPASPWRRRRRAPGPESEARGPAAAAGGGRPGDALKCELRVWTDFDQRAEVRSTLGVAGYAALRDAGMEIPSPRREVRFRQA